MPRVVLENATKIFGRNQRPALLSIDLSVEDGELLMVAGPSGAGKTTLLRIIAGLETPSLGRVLFDGVDVTSVPPRERDVAMVFQSASLYPHMTVSENMEFGLKLRGCPKSERQKRVSETAGELGISDLLKRMPREISGGEAQRVALGRALVRRPAVLLLDEPFAHLHPGLRADLRKLVRRKQEEAHKTTIWSTHGEDDLKELSARIAWLNEGRIGDQR